MAKLSAHSFHIPVLGTAYSIDTPVKVARFGISSVISVMDDELIEKMRKFYCDEWGEEYIHVLKTEFDCRARRITSYLNLVQQIVDKQVARLRSQVFAAGTELVQYFEMLPDTSSMKQLYSKMTACTNDAEKHNLQKELKEQVVPGSIDVNIMAKVDKLNTATDGQPLPAEFSDALSAFRGYAQSNLNSSVVISAGYNPRLFAYAENFADFFPSEDGSLKKRIILKVSDYRSALVQGKLLAKKGLWVSEFRIESGLNCGGHAFATDGALMGPVLEEFKNNRTRLAAELFDICNAALREKNKQVFAEIPQLKITAQGGIGTAAENDFLLQYYRLDGTGWGSPFLLVPEATNVDERTLHELSTAKKEDFYMSEASPLGITFNNFHGTTSERQRLERIEKGRPGSPCYKKMLAFDTEFTKEPLCTASRQYQELKIRQLKERQLSAEEYKNEYEEIIAKECICEGLSTPALINNHLPLSHNLSAVTICPGPNLAYFSGVFSLWEMVDHIYGRMNGLNSLHRPHMFINELQLYVTHLKNKLKRTHLDSKQLKSLETLKNNLLKSIEYYRQLFTGSLQKTISLQELNELELEIKNTGLAV